MSIESVMPSKYLILCCPLLLLPSIFPHQGLFNESALRIRWPKYWIQSDTQQRLCPQQETEPQRKSLYTGWRDCVGHKPEKQVHQPDNQPGTWPENSQHRNTVPHSARCRQIYQRKSKKPSQGSSHQRHRPGTLSETLPEKLPDTQAEKYQIGRAHV